MNVNLNPQWFFYTCFSANQRHIIHIFKLCSLAQSICTTVIKVFQISSRVNVLHLIVRTVAAWKTFPSCNHFFLESLLEDKGNTVEFLFKKNLLSLTLWHITYTPGPHTQLVCIKSKIAYQKDYIVVLQNRG